ncbi:MAG TPA: hypothetical protein VGU63_15365 [Candidatus Acidoferrales bacterium]|nr:hypothetical protein [Candidatus Acidoferrales bacterium]
MKLRFADTAVLVILTLTIATSLRAQSTNPPGTTTQSANASPAQPSTSAASVTPVVPSPKYFQVPSGTRLPLVLHNAISTRSAKAGDPVYLETLFPIVIDSRILIPAGSYVSGEITEAKRPGRIHGRGEIKIRLDNLILPNGYQASFNASPTNAGTGGNESIGKEGAIKADSNKTADAGTVLETTAAGAGIGGIASQSARGVGIGAGAGAAAGLLAVLLTRGPEAELPRGTTLDVIMNRPLYLLSSKANFTTPGQSSTLAGPPNREPQRRTGIIPH